MQPEILNNSLARIFSELKTSLGSCKSYPSDEDLKEIADLIDSSMAGQHRHFHNSLHVFDLLVANDPVLNLAALFHDTVYYQVDQGFPPNAVEFLKAVTRQDGDDLYLCDSALRDFPNLRIVCSVFAIAPGQKLNPLRGLNEFLSAVLATKVLTPFLEPKMLLQIVACIEGTIPFRSEENSQSSMNSLFSALQKCNQELSLLMTEQELVIAIKRAVDLGNRDVKNFASNNHSLFLATTWLLLPERNKKLCGNQYTVKDYRLSLQKMKEFFKFLSAEVVFKRFADFPDFDTLETLKNAARKNISISRSYLKVKLVAVTLLEALANATGGDLPMVQLLGAVRPQGAKGVRMEDFLPLGPERLPTNDPILFDLLNEGRAQEISFDLQNSPLATFIYAQLSDAEIESATKMGKQFFEGEISAFAYLSHFPDTILTPVSLACAKSCPSRADLISEQLRLLKQHSTRGSTAS